MDEDKPRRDPEHLTGPNLLREAKGLLMMRGWGRGPIALRSTPCLCAAEACMMVWKGSGPISPMKALAAAINPAFKPSDYGDKQVGIVLDWNDAPGRTLEDVYAMFDRAAAIAEEEAAKYVPL